MERTIRGRRARLGLSVARDAVLATSCAFLATACLVPEPLPPEGDPAGTVEQQPTESPQVAVDERSAAGVQEPQPAEPGTAVDATKEPALEPTEAGAPVADPSTEAPVSDPTANAAEPQPAEAAPQDPEQEGGEEAAEPDLPVDPAPVVVVETNGAEPVEPPPPPPGVITIVERYYDRMDARDWSAARECFWDDATITRLRAPGEGQPTRVLVLPAQEVLRRFEAGEEGPEESVRGGLDGPPVVNASGTVAQAWCRYVGRFIREEGDESRWTRYDSLVLVQHDKVWRIAALVQGLSQERR